MLITQEIRKSLPALYAMEHVTDPLVICKFFMPATKWTWYVIEFDGYDRFFGYVIGDYNELGYFSLAELEAIEGPFGLSVERDMSFEVCPLSEVKRIHE